MYDWKLPDSQVVKDRIPKTYTVRRRSSILAIEFDAKIVFWASGIVTSLN